MKGYSFLIVAILFETIATSFLKKTQQFTQLVPTIIFFVSIFLSFYLLSLALRSIPVGVAYAIWSAVGIVLVSLAAYFFYGQRLEIPTVIGIIFIIIGVVIINLS